MWRLAASDCKLCVYAECQVAECLMVICQKCIEKKLNVGQYKYRCFVYQTFEENKNIKQHLLQVVWNV